MVKVEIRWSINSVNNLEEIAEYISENSPLYAPVFINKIIQSVDRLIDFPFSGRIVPEYENENIREVIFHNYRIIYKINNNNIDVSDVIHSSRLIE